MPNAVLEAMAHGIAVVATDVGEISRLLLPRAGVVVPSGDSDWLADAIARYLDDAGARRAAGLEGRRRAREDYSIESLCRRTLALVWGETGERDRHGAGIATPGDGEAGAPPTPDVVERPAP
jgi:glycosyltransferase involved in cell wall biosynthesis